MRLLIDHWFWSVDMIEDLKMPVSSLREDIMNVWGRL